MSGWEEVNPGRPGRFWVFCATHALNRYVDTEAHARNLFALHERTDHADDTQIIAVDLTAAAALVVEADEYPDDRWFAATVALWEALTGLTDSAESVAYARAIAAADPPITAHIPPF